MTERTIKIKELIHDEVCMGTYGLAELELLEIEKETEALRQLAVINRRELLIDFLMEVDEVYGMHIRENAENCADNYLKSINSL